MKSVMVQDGVIVVRGHECVSGQALGSGGDTMQAAAKRTGWLTNLEEVPEALGRDFESWHVHVQLVDGTAKADERYPPALVARVLRAVRDGIRRVRGSDVGAIEVGSHIDEDPLTLDSTFEHLESMQIWNEYFGLVLRPGSIAKSVLRK